MKVLEFNIIYCYNKYIQPRKKISKLNDDMNTCRKSNKAKQQYIYYFVEANTALLELFARNRSVDFLLFLDRLHEV